jgi:outer membrane immunogenic protein
VGYLPWDTLLTFVSSGYTEANFKAINFVDLLALATPSLAERKYTGWFLGGGYEYRFDWLPGLYWKTEYRFSTFNKKDNPILGLGGTEFVHSEKFIQTVTSSLVWRFNWWR